MPRRLTCRFLWTLALACLVALPAWAQVRLKDIVSIEGVRGNQLVGYGLVIGLQGTGDQLRNTPFTQQSLAAMLERMGINVADARVQTRNTAAVIVTATLPPFARQGTPIDVQVSSLGDSRSLNGGTLIVTPLLGADGEVYAVAQGPVVVGGFQAAGQAQSISSGVTTQGRVPGGGLVEREVPVSLRNLDSIRLALRAPDFTTAIRIEEVLNARFGPGSAQALDLGTVEVKIPFGFRDRLPALVAQMEGLQVRPETTARVVVDERTGTIIVGASVRVEPVAITHGNLVIRVTESPVASQPGPLSNGETVVLPRTQVEVDDQRGRQLAVLPRASTLQALVNGLNALGLAPRDLISVLNVLKASGALHAELQFI
ncbi:flagellar basal body P-ring protein FlgI [Roseomonas marmotae]|uniref:Flagellar P-ring protein n=1 Tax=Roseomonas marmotae TaxID=2768161 RepID=A0ABS3KF10_9PROT|nr:flagellar basal body P-ring protein FlgI [Roseomonas marmotae]MBO1076045.1 flagellar basal body P-ring protein FlgI [Roseomonas marmotae]QTI81284.1 flagellar basal body P-ring protein FlgI [Roseomonas marmotae]